MAEMTSRERLLAAIRHEEPDRVPVAPRIWAFLQDYYGSSDWPLYLRAAREFGLDIYHNAASIGTGLCSRPQLTYRHLPPEVRVTQRVEEQDGGVSIWRTFETPAGPLRDHTFLAPEGREYGISPSPVHHENLLKERDDLDRLRYIMPDPTRVNLATYHEIARLIGESGIVEISINSALDHNAGDARGLGQLMMDYHLDRPFFDAILAFFHEHQQATLRAALEQGARYILGSWFFASLSAGWSPAIFRECFTPLIRDQAELVHRYGGIYHAYDDGKMMWTLGEYVSAGSDVVETLTPPPVGDVDLAEAKRLYGDQVCLKGYVDLLYVLKMGTVDDVARAVRYAIEVAAPGGGFILGASDSIRDGTPTENVRAYFETARQYGRYRPMTIALADIRQGIRDLGLANLSLCVHSSLRSFGGVEGGPDAIINGLLEEGCTVLVPTFTGGFRVPCPPELRPPRNGRDYVASREPAPGLGRIYTPETNEIDTYRMGVVAEALLRYPGRHRGDHAACSFAAVGPLAQELVRDQAPLDVFAPFQALARQGGWVVLMGVWLDRLTLLHLAEKLAGRSLFRFCANGRDGQPIALEGGGCSSGFTNLAPLLEPLMRRTTVGDSLWRAFPAQETLAVATEAIRRDPQITHCDNPACRSCNDSVAGGPIL